MITGVVTLLFCALLCAGISYRSSLYAKYGAIGADMFSIFGVYLKFLFVKVTVVGAIGSGILYYVSASLNSLVFLVGVLFAFMIVFLSCALAPRFAIGVLRNVDRRHIIATRGLGGVSIVLSALTLIAFSVLRGVAATNFTAGFLVASLMSIMFSGLLSKGADRAADKMRKLRHALPAKYALATKVDDAGDYFADLSNHVLGWVSLMLLVLSVSASVSAPIHQFVFLAIGISLCVCAIVMLFLELTSFQDILDRLIMGLLAILGFVFAGDYVMDLAHSRELYLSTLGAFTISVVSLFCIRAASSGSGYAGRQVIGFAKKHVSKLPWISFVLIVLVLLWASFVEWSVVYFVSAGALLSMAGAISALGVYVMVATSTAHVLDNAGALARSTSFETKRMLAKDDEIGNSLAALSKVMLAVAVSMIATFLALSGSGISVFAVASIIMGLLLFCWIMFQSAALVQRMFEKRVGLFLICMFSLTATLSLSAIGLLAGFFAGHVSMLVMGVALGVSLVVAIILAVIGALFDNAKKVGKMRHLDPRVRRALIRLDLLGDTLKDVIAPSLIALSMVVVVLFLII